MKKILTLMLVLTVCIGSAQDSTFIRNDSLFTSSGYVIVPDQNLKLGTGSLPDGDFKYISRNTNSLFYGTTDNRSMQNGYNSLPRQQAHHEYKVVKVQSVGNRKHGYAFYAIINIGIVRYQVDIDDAIASGEVIVPDEYKQKNTVTAPSASPQEDMYDKLAKLKKLLDDSAITQQEYDEQKKKLLDQQ